MDWVIMQNNSDHGCDRYTIEKIGGLFTSNPRHDSKRKGTLLDYILGSVSNRFADDIGYRRIIPATRKNLLPSLRTKGSLYFSQLPKTGVT